MITLISVFLICLVLSAFFSCSEMAFVSSNRLRMREMADSGNKPAQRILRLLAYPENFLTMILIGNNIVNVTATAILTYAFEIYGGIENEWVVTAVIAPIIIIFGEMVPKDYGRLRSENYLLSFVGVLSFLLKLFHYPVRILLRMVDFFLSPLGEAIEKSIFVSEQEFRVLIEESAKTGVLGHHEKQLIDTVLDFERKHIDSVMIAWEKASKMDIHGSIGEAKEIARRTKTKMILVYEEISAIIVGVIYVYDILFEEEENQPLKKYLRSPIFLPQNTSIEKAFLTLQEKSQSFAVVTNFSGDAMGVVPIERLLTL